MVHGSFFNRVSNTLKMMKSCLDVLKKDRELILFPVFAAISVAIFVLILSAGGYLDNLDTEQGGSLAPLILLIFGANFLIVFFNSALVSAALERLRGGDPNVKSGLSHAIKHIHHIFFWSIIVTIVAILIAIIRGDRRENSIFREIFASIIQAGWAMMTFFVVPIIVSENIGPINAIKRSTSLFKQTWGDQVVANFGFGIFQLFGVLLGVVVGWFFGLFSPLLGAILGGSLAVMSVAIIYTLEGIYKAASMNLLLVKNLLNSSKKI